MCSLRFLNHPGLFFTGVDQYISWLVPLPVLDAATRLAFFPFSLLPLPSPVPTSAALIDRHFPKSVHTFRWHSHQPAIPASKKSENLLRHHSSFPDRFDKICRVLSPVLSCGDLLRGAAAQGVDQRAPGIFCLMAVVGVTWGACRTHTGWSCSHQGQSHPSFPSSHWGIGNGLTLQHSSWRGAEHGCRVLQQNPR